MMSKKNYFFGLGLPVFNMPNSWAWKSGWIQHLADFDHSFWRLSDIYESDHVWLKFKSRVLHLTIRSFFGFDPKIWVERLGILKTGRPRPQIIKKFCFNEDESFLKTLNWPLLPPRILVCCVHSQLYLGITVNLKNNLQYILQYFVWQMSLGRWKRPKFNHLTYETSQFDWFDQWWRHHEESGHYFCPYSSLFQ